MAVCVTAQAGDISGKVTAGGVSRIFNPSLHMYERAVVYVEAVPGKTFPAPATPLLMDQRSLSFQPHILAAPAGSTVEFLNSDKVAHNIFWPSISGNKKLGRNLGTWPSGEKRAFKFETPGIVPLLCNAHSEMSGYIIVTPTPFYAETDASGAFKIANVPAGSYTVTAWHEGFKTQSKPVTVAGQATVDFDLSK